MKRKTKPMLRSLTIRIVCAVFMLWLTCMYAITSVAAEGFFVEFSHMGDELIDNTWAIARFNERLDGDEEQLPGYEEYVLWEAVRSIGTNSRYNALYGNHDVTHRPVLKTDRLSFDTEAAVFDGGGSIVAYPSNFFTFYYYYEADYQAGDTTVRGYAVCVLDRQVESEMSRFIISQTFGSLPYSTLYYRFTGALENGYFTVYQIEYCLDPHYTESGKPEWRDAPSYGIEIPDGTETVTLYANDVQVNTYTPSRSFEYQGNKINDLADYLNQIGPGLEYGQGRQYSFTDFVYGVPRFYRDLSNFDGTDETYPKLEYKLVTVMLASPWRSAVSSLHNVYIVTLLIAITGILWLRKAIRRNVAEPVAAVNQGIAEDWRNVRGPDDPPLKYKETAELLEHYEETKAQMSRNNDALVRLERAVKYAREAEQNRRQMTSSIAHELKTPLAVIHSYSEGLRERIAEDKRDKYLDVILSETERMDGMVLEMLDLSRLEAGKVKLSREDFSISEMAASVFERLERAAEAKELKITFEMEEDCIINADPVRIEQVIMNFAVNAIKYTPHGGDIRVRTEKSRGNITFAVENESQHLSLRALSMVWDTFYRGDESRTGEGTGLGLAIAKEVIDLHGGECYARNTKIGVEFMFTIS